MTIAPASQAAIRQGRMLRLVGIQADFYSAFRRIRDPLVHTNARPGIRYQRPLGIEGVVQETCRFLA